MNLSPNMLAALRFFAGNVSEHTKTADKLLNTTVNALWRRGLLAVDTDGIIIPNEAGFAALAAVETTEQSTNQVESESLTVGQISDELRAKISPNFYAQVRAGEQAATEEARHSSMDAGIQSQGSEGTESNTEFGVWVSFLGNNQAKETAPSEAMKEAETSLEKMAAFNESLHCALNLVSGCVSLEVVVHHIFIAQDRNVTNNPRAHYCAIQQLTDLRDSLQLGMNRLIDLYRLDCAEEARQDAQPSTDVAG
jgi:hypothetical protein